MNFYFGLPVLGETLPNSDVPIITDVNVEVLYLSKMNK